MLNFESFCNLLKENINPIFTAEQIAAMREWVADCSWGDMDEESLAELTDEQIIRGVNKHYDGGIREFLRAI
jgi:hypothetical protein